VFHTQHATGALSCPVLLPSNGIANAKGKMDIKKRPGPDQSRHSHIPAVFIPNWKDNRTGRQEEGRKIGEKSYPASNTGWYKKIIKSCIMCVGGERNLHRQIRRIEKR
jgi:hypothetical protein